MSDSKPQKDPSMDDILSSIRKIIQEDEGRAAAAPGGGPPAVAAPESGGPMMGIGVPIGAPGRPGGSPPRDDDVLLLTDLVDDPDAGVARTPPRPAVVASPPADLPPAAAAPAVGPGSGPAMAMAVPLAVVTPSAEPPPAVPAPPPVAAVLSPPAPPVAPVVQPPIETNPMTTNPISSAMDRLARAVEDAKPPIAAPDSGPTMSSGRTLEDVVKEMLRPLLQEWIDKNLPQLVERIVDREVQRLTRG